MTRRLLDYGSNAVLLECADLTDALSLQPLIKTQIGQITEIIPGARTLMLRLTEPLSPADRKTLLTLPGQAQSVADQESVVIEVDYSGPDLEEVSSLTGLSAEEVVAAHTGQLWTVAFCGFAPGFGYLHGEDERLRVPRRSTPRTKVPPGAVGLADEWSGIYPRSGPGGWQLIGRTDAPLWDLDRDPPALLQPGMQIRFESSGRS
jgi:KipI family sensor histidine kinase inhibitor